MDGGSLIEIRRNTRREIGSALKEGDHVQGFFDPWTPITPPEVVNGFENRLPFGFMN